FVIFICPAIGVLDVGLAAFPKGKSVSSQWTVTFVSNIVRLGPPISRRMSRAVVSTVVSAKLPRRKRRRNESNHSDDNNERGKTKNVHCGPPRRRGPILVLTRPQEV